MAFASGVPRAEWSLSVLYAATPLRKEKPPESCDKEDQTTVAAFRPWRGLSALNPQSLTGLQTMRGNSVNTTGIVHKKYVLSLAKAKLRGFKVHALNSAR